MGKKNKNKQKPAPVANPNSVAPKADHSQYPHKGHGEYLPCEVVLMRFKKEAMYGDSVIYPAGDHEVPVPMVDRWLKRGAAIVSDLDQEPVAAPADSDDNNDDGTNGENDSDDNNESDETKSEDNEEDQDEE